MNTVYQIIADQPGELMYGLDCDCACPQQLPQQPAQIADWNADDRVELLPGLQQLALDAEHTLVCVPSYSRVAVLNRPALELLEQLRRPLRPIELEPAARNAVRNLLNLGLLRTPGSPLAAPGSADELVAWLHVTNACNLRCTYCYVDKTDEAMPVETAYAAVDSVLRAARQHGYRRVLLKYAGGEASLNLDLVEQIQRYAGVHAGAIELRGVVLSNGVGLTRHKLERIRALGLRLMISLDGPQQFHDAQRPRLGGQGSFAAVIGGIERARQLGLDLIVSVTITGRSAAGLAELTGWLLERRLRFAFNFYREHDCSSSFAELQLDQQQLIDGLRAAYRVIETQLPEYSLLACLLDRTNLGVAHSTTCAAGENYMVIDHRGRIAKCQMELARPVTSVWEADPLSVIRLESRGLQNLPVDQKTGCRDCQWKYWCSGGCAVATYRATGRYDIKSPNCEIYKALYPDVLRLEGLRLLRAFRTAARQQHAVAATCAV